MHQGMHVDHRGNGVYDDATHASAITKLSRPSYLVHTPGTAGCGPASYADGCPFTGCAVSEPGAVAGAA